MRFGAQDGATYKSKVGLSARQQAILMAIVEHYVATGEPVPSQVIATGCHLSSATVRNTMAELVDLSYLEQPHTSAGRVPTAKGFRLHVEQLRGGNRIDSALLPVLSRLQIDATLYGITSAPVFLERTPQILALLSSGVGVAITTVQAGDLLEHAHFQRLASRRVLAVVVTRSGIVRDRVLTLEQDLQAEDLEAASRYLNENFRGWTMEHVRAEIASRAETERSEYRQMRTAAQDLWTAAMAQQGPPAQTVHVEGVSNLIGDGYDRVRLREMLAALEAKERVVALLHAYMGAEQMELAHGTGLRVIFDMESHTPEMQGLVLVAAPAMRDGTQHGAVGVIGMQRMHYENTINAVQYVAQLFAESQTRI